jgi:glyoxylase-like metal-dependent hydrolase (beta-lactamase superfamily II)
MNKDLRIREIRSHNFESNTYVVIGDTAIIFDAGAKVEDVENVLDGKVPKALFITHSHFDHILHIDDYVEKYNMPVYISTHGIDRLYNENLNLSASILGKVVKVGKGAELKVVEDNIRIGDVDIKCISTPGHSDCSTTYVVGGYAIVGDVIFENAIGRYDLFDGDYGKLFNSIKVIKRLNVKRYFPGHGDSFEK